MFILTFKFEDGEELSIETDDPARDIAGQIRMRGKSAIKSFNAKKPHRTPSNQIEIGFPRRDVLK